MKGGNSVVMDETESYIENKCNGKRIPIRRENGMFVVTVRVPKGAVKNVERQYAIMATEDSESFRRQVKVLV